MARLSFNELVRAVTEHPDFREHWEVGVAPDQALYIAFSSTRPSRLDSETFEALDGSIVVVDRDADGLVCGIEIT